MFSKSCKYGIRAVICIATQEKRVGLKTIADEIDSPQAFTAKILQQLTRHKIISSVKGPHGGFEITPERKKTVNLMDIVNVLDGDALFTSCALGLDRCNAAKPCPLHFEFVEVRENLQKMLESATLEMLIREMDSDLSWLKRLI